MKVDDFIKASTGSNGEKGAPIYKQIREAISRTETTDAPPKKEVPCPVVRLIASLIAVNGIAHTMHLNTVNYETHKVLDRLYKELPEHIDLLAEVTIGLYGVHIPCFQEKFECPFKMVHEMICRTKQAHEYSKEPAIINAIENIWSFLGQIQYLLRLQ